MTRGDQTVEHAAGKLDDLAQGVARDDGVKSKLAEPLADDAALLRGMRPSRIAARLRGAPGGEPGSQQSLPAPGPKARAKPKRNGGPNPILLAGGAFAVGIVLAKVIDWRGHAHPR